VIGVGSFAANQARVALASTGLPVMSILHPSPASPAANRGWVAHVERQLLAHGVDLPPVRRARQPRRGAVRR
jgi:single-strand selective monofunctional uracil DNA glycosylase